MKRYARYTTFGLEFWPFAPRSNLSARVGDRCEIGQAGIYYRIEVERLHEAEPCVGAFMPCHLCFMGGVASKIYQIKTIRERLSSRERDASSAGGDFPNRTIAGKPSAGIDDEALKQGALARLRSSFRKRG